MKQAAVVQAQIDCQSVRRTYEDSLPPPTPIPSSHYGAQSVNESDAPLLAAANAAHQCEHPGTVVVPLEGTWLMQTKGQSGSVLTIDIPPARENAICGRGTKVAGNAFFEHEAAVISRMALQVMRQVLILDLNQLEED
jgi:hypothetical protein